MSNFNNDMTVNFYEVVKAIKRLGRGKSKGPNRVSADMISKYIYVYDNQFAFKKDLSTEQIISDYRKNNILEFTCFIDIKKSLTV